MEERCYICNGDTSTFDVLKWWSVNNMKFHMTHDMLFILITTIASEDTFSVQEITIGSYHVSLAPDTI